MSLFKRTNTLGAVVGLSVLVGCDINVNHKRRLCENNLEVLDMLYDRDQIDSTMRSYDPPLSAQEREHLYATRAAHQRYMKMSWYKQLTTERPSMGWDHLRDDLYFYHWFDAAEMSHRGHYY